MWLIFAISLATAVVLTPVARHAARRLGVLDCPDGRRKLHARPVPLWGGVAVYLSFVLGLGAAHVVLPELPPGFSSLASVLISAAGYVCLLGCCDDSWNLSARFKLALQVVSVLPIVAAGYWIDRLVLLGISISLGPLGIVLTVAWLVACINALNLLDGMDGLASAVGLSTAVMLAIIAATMGHHHVALVALTLAGALCGFLVFNLPPASIYLGDSGSMVIGLVLGMLGIQGSLKTTATLSLAVPATVLAIPMLDTALAILRRRLTGRSIAAADRGHIHHRLLERGLSTWQALCVISALCLTCGAAATAATIFRNDALAWIAVLTLLVLMVRLRAFGHYELALLKIRIAQVLQGVVQRLLGMPGQHAVDRLPHSSFERLWNLLLAELRLWNVTWLDVRTGDADGYRGHHAWHGAAAPAGAQWVLTLMLGHPDASFCQLTVAATDPTLADPLFLARLGCFLRRFASRWAAAPREVPQDRDAATRRIDIPLSEAPHPAGPHAAASPGDPTHAAAASREVPPHADVPRCRAA
jgi:UDP-GlcNAc:undecaprenyl-phosphate GlcNAc-1-phosphate transferase